MNIVDYVGINNLHLILLILVLVNQLMQWDGQGVAHVCGVHVERCLNTAGSYMGVMVKLLIRQEQHG